MTSCFLVESCVSHRWCGYRRSSVLPEVGIHDFQYNALQAVVLLEIGSEKSDCPLEQASKVNRGVAV